MAKRFALDLGPRLPAIAEASAPANREAALDPDAIRAPVREVETPGAPVGSPAVLVREVVEIPTILARPPRFRRVRADFTLPSDLLAALRAAATSVGEPASRIVERGILAELKRLS